MVSGRVKRRTQVEKPWERNADDPPARIIGLTPTWGCHSDNRPSLLSYVRHWRPKVDPEWKHPEFWLGPDGGPFTRKETLSQWVTGVVKPQFPWFHGYTGRTWCINARLIDSRDKRGKMDWVGVQKFIGHENLGTMTRYYARYVDMQLGLYGDNWLHRAFVRPDRQKASGVVRPFQVGSLHQFVEAELSGRVGI